MFWSRFAVCGCLLLTAFTLLPSRSVQAEPPNLQAGFGHDTPGGQGGKILRVTTLAANGPGSLRAALETKGKRIIVFEVAGVIDLDRKSLRIRDPFVTVAGQTAPSPGITIIKGGLQISAHDVIVQHLKIRPGDAGQPKKSDWECDGISTNGKEAYNVLIEHCSTTWATDENLSVSGPRLEGPEGTSHRVTIRHCLIAEALHNSTHIKGPHSMGSLIHDNCRDIAIIGNLYAHNNARNPYFKAFTTGVIVNNVIHDPGTNAIQLGFSLNEWKETGITPEPPRLSIVGNVYLPGVSTKARLAMIDRPGAVFVADNLMLPLKEEDLRLTGKDVKLLSEKPNWPKGLIPLPASQTLDYVASHVGARPRDRDAIDQRIVQNLLNRSGRIIHSQEDVGGYPEVKPVTRKLQVPEEKIAEWLQQLADELE